MDKCKALLIGRNSKGQIVYAINLWHEQARVRELERQARLKMQTKGLKQRGRP